MTINATGRLRSGAVSTILAVLAAALLPALAEPRFGLQAGEGPGSSPPVVRSARSGPWSAPATWEGDKVPVAGARAHVRPGHTVTYDVKADHVLRSVHVAGVLTFARDRDTRLDVGLIQVQPGNEC